MVNIGRVLKENVDSMQEQVGNVSREMETLRKNPEEIQGIKNTNK